MRAERISISGALSKISGAWSGVLRAGRARVSSAGATSGSLGATCLPVPTPSTPPHPRRLPMNTLLLGHGSQEKQSQAARTARPGVALWVLWEHWAAARYPTPRPAGKVWWGGSQGSERPDRPTPSLGSRPDPGKKETHFRRVHDLPRLLLTLAAGVGAGHQDTGLGEWVPPSLAGFRLQEKGRLPPAPARPPGPGLKLTDTAYEFGSEISRELQRRSRAPPRVSPSAPPMGAKGRSRGLDEVLWGRSGCLSTLTYPHGVTSV